jgi:hypothetical protein
MIMRCSPSRLVGMDYIYVYFINSFPYSLKFAEYFSGSCANLSTHPGQQKPYSFSLYSTVPSCGLTLPPITGHTSFHGFSIFSAFSVSPEQHPSSFCTAWFADCSLIADLSCCHLMLATLRNMATATIATTTKYIAFIFDMVYFSFFICS